MKIAVALLICALLAVSPGRAEDRGDIAGEQMAGLFVQSCVQYVGDSDGLRRWAGKLHLAALLPQGQQAFLKDRPGIVYDATNKAGKFVVISGDDGSCSVVAEFVSGAAVASALERFLSQAGIALAPVGEHADPEERALHWRDYLITAGGRSWAAALGTASGPAGGQALLSIGSQ